MKKNKKKQQLQEIMRYGIALALILAVAVLWAARNKQPDVPADSSVGTATGNFVPATSDPTTGSENTENMDAATETTEAPAKIEELVDTESESSKGLQVVSVGSYSGLFVEDGSDEVVSRILMIVVKNTGESTAQYAEVELTDGKTTACFTLSTLPPGESVVLLEKNRMSFAEGENLTQIIFRNVALFPQEPTLCEDRVQIQALNGVFNVINVSGADITGNVVIYYKNASSDMLYGGITYRTTISGGIKADEIIQVTASHFTEKGSRIMWVTVE